jgi:hypothetical protein
MTFGVLIPFWRPAFGGTKPSDVISLTLRAIHI